MRSIPPTPPPMTMKTRTPYMTTSSSFRKSRPEVPQPRLPPGPTGGRRGDGRNPGPGSRIKNPDAPGDSVAVTIYLSGHVAEVAEFPTENGAASRNVEEDYIEACVPVPLLGQLSEQPGVLRVREIVPPHPAWGDITGQGVKVGIIDTGFAGFRGLVGTELTSRIMVRCYTDIGAFTRSITA